MRTFEERYTAWIDGQLQGDSLTAFEQELARRAEAGDADSAEIDRAQALGLRALLKEHLQAPTLTNTEFFSHQMRGRIDAEIDKAARRREAAARPVWRLPSFAWPFARLAGVGLGCLFVAGALYYGMMPPRQAGPSKVAVVTPTLPPVAAVSTPVQDPVVRAPNNQVAINTVPMPAPIDLNSNEEIQVKPNPGSTASATTFPYAKGNVIWVNNLPYLPGANGANATPSPAPAPSAVPSVAPAP